MATTRDDDLYAHLPRLDEALHDYVENEDDRREVALLVVHTAEMLLDAASERARAVVDADEEPTEQERRAIRHALASASLDAALTAHEPGGREHAQFPPDRALVEPPPPIPPLRHLTSGELSRLLEIARARAEESGHGARELAAFAAHVLPRFKSTPVGSPVTVPLHEWWGASSVATGGKMLWGSLFEATNLFERIADGGHYMGALYAATYRVRSGAFVFDAAAPTKPLHLRSGPTSEIERRWESLQAAARGEDGRAVPKPARRVPRGRSGDDNPSS